MKPVAADAFRETPELAELGEKSSREFKLARNMKDAIQPKVQEFRDLMHDAQEKMSAQRDMHLERARQALIDARELMRVERLGSFDVWLETRQICGISGKPIGKAQAYRLIDGRVTGKTPKKECETSPPIIEGIRSTDPASEFLGTFTASPKKVTQPVLFRDSDEFKRWLVTFHNWQPEDQEYAKSQLNTPDFS